MHGAKSPDTLLIFAAKHVGMEIIKFLWRDEAPAARLFVSADDAELLAAAMALNIDAEIFSDETAGQLCREGRQYNWMLNLWFPHIFKPDVLEVAKHRLNVHPALLPHCRGNDCAAWAIRTDAPVGVSLLEIREGVDTGEVYAQRALSHKPAERGKELHDRLQTAAIALFIDTWPDILSGEIQPRPQTGEGSNFQRRDTEADRRRNGADTMTLKETTDWIRAHDFSPGTTAEMLMDNKRYKLTLEIEEIEDARIASDTTNTKLR